MTDLLVVVTTTSEQDDLPATLRSLALQIDIAHEIVVLDDGLAGSLQRAVDDRDTPLITFVRAGAVLFPGALRAMHDAVSRSPYVGMAHAFRLPTDAQGRVSRQVARAHAAQLRERFPPDLDHRQALVAQGDIVHALPTFRREALSASGGLSGASPDEALYRAALRVADRAGARLVPNVLCAAPRTGTRGGALWTHLAERARRLLHAARGAPLWGPLLRAPRPYEMFAGLLQRWSFDGLRLPRRRVRSTGDERIAYVVWRYPTHSDTFIRREVQALRKAGLSLEVFALEPDDPPAAADASCPAGAVTYFGPVRNATGRAFILGCLRRQPWTVVRLWLFIVRQRYRGEAVWSRDRDVLYLAGQLASALATRASTHVHSLWTNQYALVSFAASRLLGVTFSAQARASEIHRSVESPAVADRLRFAEFVVTNSRYNERYLHALLGPAGAPIHVIYNGVELSRFRPVASVERENRPFRLLAVGRLVEPKGFRYLLQACRLLRDRGVDLRCEIIGGPLEPAATVTWLELRMLLSELDVESTVCFRGQQPFSAVLEACQRSDAFVLPCVRGRDGSHDITPNSLIEAMAMGLAVVSTTSGAIPEIVEHGRDGLLVPPGDAGALADALERLIGDAALRSALGAAARRKVEERFDIDRNVTRRVTLFRSLRTE